MDQSRRDGSYCSAARCAARLRHTATPRRATAPHRGALQNQPQPSPPISGPLQGVITESPEETKKLAADLANELKPGSVLALHGDLGSGKTCFVQGLAEALGVKGMVNSPTFTIINEYQGRFRLYHIDLYRVKSTAEAELIGLDELLEGNGITAIEWPDKISPLLPKNTIHVYFEFVDVNRRRIKLHLSKS